MDYFTEQALSCGSETDSADAVRTVDFFAWWARAFYRLRARQSSFD
jgi:hypothetical protein